MYIYRERVKFNQNNLRLASICRCPCGNVLKPKHEIPKPKSIQNILFKQEHSTLHYLWKRTAIPSSSLNSELLYFFLEPLVRSRSTALMSANCTPHGFPHVSQIVVNLESFPNTSQQLPTAARDKYGKWDKYGKGKTFFCNNLRTLLKIKVV